MFPHTQPIKADHLRLNKIFHSSRNKSDILNNASKLESESNLEKEKNTSCPWPCVPKVAIPLPLDGGWLAGGPRTALVPGLGTWGSRAGFCGNMLAASSELFSGRRKQPAVANAACLDHWQVTCSASGNCCQLLPVNFFQFPLLSFWITVFWCLITWNEEHSSQQQEVSPFSVGKPSKIWVAAER